MTGRPPKQGTNNKLLSRLAAKMGGPASKRPLANPSSGGTPSKKHTNAAARKVVSEEAVAPGLKEKKDARPIFELRSTWAVGIDPISSKDDFNAQKATLNDLEGAEKELKAREIVLGAVKAILEAEKTIPTIVDAIVEFVPIMTPLLFSDSILQALFELINRIDSKDAVPAIATTISTIISTWPSKSPSSMLLKLVVNDSCGKRFWSDHSDALQTYYSVISVFGGFIIPSSDIYTQADVQWAKKPAYDESKNPKIFDSNHPILVDVIQDAIETISQRANEDASKNLLRTMAFMMQDVTIRMKAAKKMDTWLQNVKLQRNASDLMLFMACNISDIQSEDSRNILAELLLMQSFRSKQHLQVFQTCIEVFLRNCPGTMEVLVESIMEADFSMKQKLPHTYVLLQHLFSLNNVEASKVMASRLVRVLDHSRSVRQVRAFFREFMKVALRGNDFRFGQFATDMYDTIRVQYLFNDSSSTTELFKNVTGLCAVLPLAAAVQNVKEAVNQRRSTGITSASQSDTISKYMSQLRYFLRVSAEFLKWALSSEFCSNIPVAMDAYNTLLFIGGYRYFSGFGDNWPTEIEFTPAMKIVHECPLDDSIFLSILENTDLGYDRILTVLELLTLRALTVRPLNTDDPCLIVKNPDLLFERLFRLAVLPYADKHEGNVKLTQKLVYQRIWLIALKWGLISRTDALPVLYESYPLARMYFHMTLIDNSDFPIARFEGQTADEFRAIEAASLQIEARKIETSIGALRDSSDYTPSQLCVFDPQGPPKSFPDLTNHYFRFAKESLAGVALCDVRNPDILRVVARDGLADQALNTIKNAITMFPQIVETLPVVTLTLLFVNVCASTNDEEVIQNLRDRLKAFLNANAAATGDIIDFLMTKLCDPSAEDRAAALHGIQLLLGTPDTIDCPINALINLSFFDEFSGKIYLNLSKSVAFESDMNVIMSTINFIAKYMKSGDVHMIALNLTKIVERVGGDSVAHFKVHHALLQFFATYLRNLANLPASTTESDNIETDFGEIYNVHIPQFSKTIAISSKVLNGMMTLLCEAFGDSEMLDEKDENLDFLLNVWFGADAGNIKVNRVADGEAVPLLPNRLKRKMLSSKDVRISNAALTDLSVEDALLFLRSFALVPSACAKLLAIVNAASDAPTELMKKAIPYVRAYRMKGVQGAEAFLATVESQKSSMEVDESASVEIKPLVLDPLPVIPQLDLEIMRPSTSSPNFDNSNSVVTFFTSVVKGTIDDSAYNRDWTNFSVAVRKPENALAIVAAVPKLLSASANLSIPLRLTVLNLVSVAKSVESVKQALQTLFKDSRLAEYESMLSGFAPSSKTDDFKTPESLLTALSKMTSNTCDNKANQLLNKFIRLRPDIVDVTASDVVFGDQVAAIFSADSPAIHIIIENLAQKVALTAAKRTFDYLLNAYEPRAAPDLVILFVVRCVQVVNPCRRLVPSADEATILIEYVIADMSIERPSPPALSQCIKVLEAVLDHHGLNVFESVLNSISDKIEMSLKPPIDEPYIIVLNRLVIALGQKFVGCRKTIQRALKCNVNFMEDIVKPRTLGDVHKGVFFAINNVVAAVEANDEDQLGKAIGIARQYTVENPSVVVAHIQLLTNRVAPILAMTKKEHREPAAIKLLQFALETILSTGPFSYKNSVSLDLLLKVYLDFFHERVTYSSRFQDVFELLCKAALNYILENQTAAKRIFAKELSFFRAMNQIYKFDSLIALIRQLDNLAVSVASNNDSILAAVIAASS